MDIFTDHTAAQHDTVADHSALFDDAAAANDGILDRTLNHTAVGNDGVADLSRVIIMRRAGIIRTGVDRPVLMEEVLRGLVIDQGHIRIIIALEVGDRSKESAMSHTAHIQLAADLIDHIRQCEHGRKLTGLVNEIDEEFRLHHICIHENIAVLRITMVRLQREHTLLLVEIEHLAVQVGFLRIVNGMVQKI